QTGTQPFHPFGSGDERVQSSFLKSAWKDSGTLPPSTILLPVGGNDWCRFCAVLCAWNMEKEENEDKPSGPPSLRNTGSPEETEKKKIQNKNKKPNQTKTLSFSVFARVLKNTDNDAECLRENKNKPKMQTETNPKKQTLVCLTPETSGFVKQLGRQHKSMTLLSFIYLFLLLFQKTMA
ncbi:mCG1038218, isoform CRA_b, partial [Mus musculus]